MLELVLFILKQSLKELRRILASNLTPEEKVILSRSDKRGEIFLLSADISGEWVRAGKMDFWDQDDFSYNAKYVDALKSLISHGLVSHQGGHLYRLTGAGFKKKQRLSTKNSQTKGIQNAAL